MANPICLRLLPQLMRLAASRAAWTAGRSRPTKMPMMAITTSNSTRVKPVLGLESLIYASKSRRKKRNTPQQNAAL